MQGKYVTTILFFFILLFFLVHIFLLSVLLVAAFNIRRSVPVWKKLCHSELKTGDLVLFGPEHGRLKSFWFSHAPGLRRRMLDRDGHLLSFRHTAVVVVKKNGFPQLIHVHGRKKICITIQDYLDGGGGDVFVRQCPDHLRPPLTKVQQWIMEHRSLRLVPFTNILFWLFGPMLGICLAHKPNERICSQLSYEFYEDMGLTGKSQPGCRVLVTPQTLADIDETPWLGPLKRVVIKKIYNPVAVIKKNDWDRYKSYQANNDSVNFLKLLCLLRFFILLRRRFFPLLRGTTRPLLKVSFLGLSSPLM